MNKDKIVATRNIYETKDYSRWINAEGEIINPLPHNRSIDQHHVSRLKRKIEKEGNLTFYFPITITPEGYIFDGQHRVLALALLNLPIYYFVQEELPTGDVIKINTGIKNWTWLNFAEHFAGNNNKDYQKIIQLHDLFNDQLYVLLPFTRINNENKGNTSGTNKHNFKTGDWKFVVPFDVASNLLEQFHELIGVLNMKGNPAIAQAFLAKMRDSGYEHNEALEALGTYSYLFTNAYTYSDYFLGFERAMASYRSAKPQAIPNEVDLKV